MTPSAPRLHHVPLTGPLITVPTTRNTVHGTVMVTCHCNSLPREVVLRRPLRWQTQGWSSSGM